MRVALAFPGCHRRAGVERIVYECARYLAAERHDVTVYANEWDEEAVPGLEYQYVPVRRRPAFMRPRSYFRNCSRQFTMDKHDVLSAHGCLCPFGGVHWVQSVHRAWLECSRKFRKPLSVAGIKQRVNPQHLVLLALESRHFRERNYRRVAATTTHLGKDLTRLYGVPPEDIVVVPNGFAPSEFNPEQRCARRMEMRSRLGLKADDVALLFAANELERKGYRTILGALRKLNRSDLRLLAVGRHNAEEAKREAERFGVAPQVLICGSTSDVAGYHAASDLFVLPTQYEAFSLAILEALGSGLPVVTSRVPGAQDAIVPGTNGALLDDPLNSVQLAELMAPLLDKAERDRMSSLTPATVRQYQWPEVLRRYESLLLENCG